MEKINSIEQLDALGEMKDKNGIEICCKNCNDDVAINCPHYNPDNPDEDFGCVVSGRFVPSYDALFARIALLEKKLTETIKLLSERSRECGELEAYNKVLQRRIEEFSMELLDQNMRDNKDVLERLKNWEEYLDKDLSTQSTDAADRSKNRENSAESEEK